MSGVVCHIDYDRLVARARDAGCTLELVPALGEFMAAGAPLLLVRDGDPARLADGCHRSRRPGPRTNARAGRGVRPAHARRHRRAIARGLAVPRSDDRRAGDRPPPRLPAPARAPAVSGRPPSRRRRASCGWSVPVMTWDAYVHLAFDEIRQAGAGSPQVARRLRCLARRSPRVRAGRAHPRPRRAARLARRGGATCRTRSGARVFARAGSPGNRSSLRRAVRLAA